MHLSHIIALGFCAVTLGGAAIALYLSRRPMTDADLWRAKKTILIHTVTEADRLAKALRSKLSDPRFTETEEMPGGREFHVRFRRNQWTLGVKVHLKVNPSPAGSTLSIQCFPEWFSKLDMVESYRTDLQAFADSVCAVKIPDTA